MRLDVEAHRVALDAVLRSSAEVLQGTDGTVRPVFRREVEELVTPPGGGQLFLSHWPVTDVVRVETVAGEEISPDLYQVRGDRRQTLYCQEGWPVPTAARNLQHRTPAGGDPYTHRVIYAGGWYGWGDGEGAPDWQQLPANLRDAAILTAESWYRGDLSRQAAVRRVADEQASVSYFAGHEGRVLPAAAERLARRYR